MVQTISADRSATAIQVSAALSNVSNIICVIAFLTLCNYFRSRKSDKINPKMKTSAIVPILTSIVTNTWFGVLGNNSIWSFVNHLFPFISTHCALSMRMILVLVHIDMYAFSMFILLQTQHLFDSIPSVGVNQKLHSCFKYLLSAVAILYVMASIAAPHDAFNVTVYNSNGYKQCELTFVADHEALVIFPWLVISQNLLQLILLLICVKQVYDLKKSPNLSQYFSGRQSNKHIIYRFLYFTIAFILSYWSCFVILAYFQWTFFAVPIAIKVSAICLSFDVYARKQSVAPRRKRVISPQKQIISVEALQFKATCGKLTPGMRLTSRTRRSQYGQTREHSYSHSHSFSLSHSHSEIFEIFEEEYREEACAKYDVAIEYVEDCKIIQAILTQLFIPSIYARIIAEYAATQYMPCMYCQKLFGCIECRNDYMVDCGTTAVGDEHDAARYYLDCEPEDLSQCEADNAFSQQTEILCVDCAKDKICGVCKDVLILSHTEIVDECLSCKMAVCEECSYGLQYENADGVEFTLCPKCNESVDQETINGFIRDQSVSLSAKWFNTNGNGEENSTSNDWRKWDFGTFNFA